MSDSRILGNTWYADELGVDRVAELARGRLWSRVIRSPTGRGVALWWFGRRYDVVVTTLAGEDTRALFMMEWLFGRRRGRHLVLLEFIPVVGREARSRWGVAGRIRRVLAWLYWRQVVRPVLRRGLLVAQSLTRWETERNARHFGLPLDRFEFVPFFSEVGEEPRRESELSEGVMASGRAACDWETVFAAARDAMWPLTAVCSRADLERVTRLARGGSATILCEISREEHARRMRSARVYLLALTEAEVSSGHVRLGEAAGAGTPVAASAVRGIQDYVVPGETAITFPPGDPVAARSAVSRLYGDAALRRRLTETARARARHWGRADYLEAVDRLVRDAWGPAWASPCERTRTSSGSIDR